jgi:predicted nucleic acid-binding protein
LLDRVNNGVSQLFELIERELILFNFNLEEEKNIIFNLMKKYKDIHISLADACLVRMSEKIAGGVICTLDTDFKIYRKERTGIFPVIIPENI